MSTTKDAPHYFEIHNDASDYERCAGSLTLSHEKPNGARAAVCPVCKRGIFVERRSQMLKQARVTVSYAEEALARAQADLAQVLALGRTPAAKTYLVPDRNGNPVRVTVPEDDEAPAPARAKKAVR